MRVAVIITTYNERENIVRMLDVTTRSINSDKTHQYKILVVDDNSPDGTGDLVRSYAGFGKSLLMLTGKKNGLGRAIIKGYKYAMTELNADVVISNEADFAFDPKKIPFMVQKIEEGWDVVIGSRHVGSGKTTGWTWSRKLNHWVANKLFATWIAGVTEVYDHNGEFRAIRVKGVLDRIDFDNLNVSGFGFFNYSLFKLTQITSKFFEFPVNYKFRKQGESKISFNPKYIGTYLRDVLEYIKLSFKIRLEKSNIRL